MKNFLSEKICLALVIIQQIQIFLTFLIGKMKDEFGAVIVNEFVELKSKMYSMKKVDGKEYNAAKGVSTATEFDKFKEFYLMKKLLETK